MAVTYLKKQAPEPILKPPKPAPITQLIESAKEGDMEAINATLAYDIPLYFSPSVAALIGINEAIFLQKLNYWVEKGIEKTNMVYKPYEGNIHVRGYGREIEGLWYIFNTLEQWRQQFPFMSIREIQYTIEHLEKTKCIRRTAKKWGRGYGYTVVLGDYLPDVHPTLVNLGEYENSLQPSYVGDKIVWSMKGPILHTEHNKMVMKLNVFDILQFGMSGAIVLAHIKFQTIGTKKKPKPDGYVWYRASLDRLTNDLQSCLSTPTIERAITKLRKLNILAITTKWNTNQRDDRTLSYRVNIPELQALFEGLPYQVSFKLP